MDVAKLLRFLACIVCKVARHGIIRLAGLHQVHRNCCKLQGCTALQKQNLVVIRNLHHTTQRGLGILNDRVIDL